MSGTFTDLQRWFSAERLAPYARACEGDRDRAVALYAWNGELAAALWRTLGHVEVLLRNGLHEQLTAHSRRRHGDGRWYLTMTPVLNERTREDIGEARRRATRTGRAETPGRVVAELNLGFWRYLLSRHYERTLWLPALRWAFPHLHGIRRTVERPVADLHVLRNRIGHHEPIHHQPIRHRRQQALDLAGWIDPAARDWIAAGDGIGELLHHKP